VKPDVAVLVLIHQILIVPTLRAHRYTQVPASRSAVIPAGMQESSAMDGSQILGNKDMAENNYQTG